METSINDFVFWRGGSTSKIIETPISHDKKRQPGKVGGKNCLMSDDVCGQPLMPVDCLGVCKQ